MPGRGGWATERLRSLVSGVSGTATGPTLAGCRGVAGTGPGRWPRVVPGPGGDPDLLPVGVGEGGDQRGRGLELLLAGGDGGSDQRVQGGDPDLPVGGGEGGDRLGLGGELELPPVGRDGGGDQRGAGRGPELPPDGGGGGGADHWRRGGDGGDPGDVGARVLESVH